MRLSPRIVPTRIRRSLGPLTLALFALAAVGATTPALCGMIEPEWLARYDSNNGFDRANAMAVTADGVYIAGDSDNGNFLSEDMFVARYDLGGELVWASTYVGPAGGRDRGLAIAVAPTGEVFVSGVSWDGESSGDDIVTILFSADGVEQWVRRWDGEFHHTDRPMAIALDGEGGVVVSGWTTIGMIQGLYETGFVTIRYDHEGGLVWVSEHTGTADVHRDTPFDVAVDNAGDVYVTGSTFEAGTGWDYSTVKYRGTDGQLFWNRTYDHNGSIQESFAIAAGEDGVCVTGSSSTVPLDGRRVDAVTIRYNADGEQQWIAIYDGPASEIDQGRDIVFYPDGGVCVVGSSTGISTQSDLLTIRYAPNGQPVWTRTFDGPQHSFEFGEHVALDESGNVFVSGTSHYFRSTADALLVLYTPDGDLTGFTVYDGPSATNDFVAGVGHDGAGGVYIAGHARYAADGTSWDAIVIKVPGGDTSDVIASDGTAPDPRTPHGTDAASLSSVRLAPAFPNPFRSVTTLAMDLDLPASVQLAVHDAVGRQIRLLASENRDAGQHRISWDGTDDAGLAMPAGVYFVALQAGGPLRGAGTVGPSSLRQTQRVVLVR